jgi:hypothetical protein
MNVPTRYLEAGQQECDSDPSGNAADNRFYGAEFQDLVRYQPRFLQPCFQLIPVIAPYGKGKDVDGLFLRQMIFSRSAD